MKSESGFSLAMASQPFIQYFFIKKFTFFNEQDTLLKTREQKVTNESNTLPIGRKMPMHSGKCPNLATR